MRDSTEVSLAANSSVVRHAQKSIVPSTGWATRLELRSTKASDAIPDALSMDGSRARLSRSQGDVMIVAVSRDVQADYLA